MSEPHREPNGAEPEPEREPERDPAPDDAQQAPEGAVCAKHPERGAYFTCPRCGSYACAFCWHPSVKRCHGCIERDPTEAAPPIPWEAEDDDGRSLLGRYVATLGTAFRPMRTAPAFARPGMASAWRFMLLSALPLSMLAGIIPHTRTLLFSGHFHVLLLGTPDGAHIALDVVRAMLAQAALLAIDLACLYLPFTSLVRAYAPERYHAAARVVLYRLWLLPATLLLYFLLGWAGPSPLESEPGALLVAALLASFLIPVFLIVAMGGVARLACGVGPFMTLVVVGVPMVLLMLVQPLASMGLEQLLPPSPPLQ